MNKEEIFNLRIFIDHSSSIQEGSSLSEAASFFKKTRSRFAAVLRGRKVIGITTPQAIFLQLDSENRTKSVSRNCLTPNPTICCLAVSTEENIQYVLTRHDDQLLDDIVLIDESMDFVGLITANSFLRIQHRYHKEAIEQRDRELDKAKEAICDLEHDLKFTRLQLKEKTQIITQLNNLRSAFISRFSHEARTPMMSIQGTLELLAGTNIPTDKKQMIHAASACTRTLLRLIQSTQDFAQVETDNIKISDTTFSPVGVLEKSVLATEAEAKDKGLIVKLEHHEIPEYIIGDEYRLQQVVENLLGKAIDHTEDGGIQITATKQECKRLTLLRIQIQDTSNGWNASEADRLFESEPTIASSPINDIGTLVSQRIVRKMGGSLSSHYEKGKGTLLTIEIPVRVFTQHSKVIATNGKQGEEKETDQSHTPNLSVLIIDDNYVNLQVARQFLEKLGCSVHLAASGQEGIDTLRIQAIDCIFLDCRMPRLTGHDVAKLIRAGTAGAENSDVFISAMTAQTSEQSRQECFESGMDFFIPKPASRQHFQEALEASRKKNESPINLFRKAAATG